MTTQLQTFDLFGQNDLDEKQREEEAARFELGWEEVRRGLTKILTGHLLTLGTIGLLVGIVIWAVIPEDPQAKQRASKLTKELFVELGFGAVIIAAVISYGWIVVGHWRCLLYAPERHFTRWYMFACFVCLLMSPALNRVAILLSGPPPAPAANVDPRDAAREWKKMVADQQDDFRAGLASARGSMQLVSFFTGVLSFGCFILFLRGIARCFDDTIRVVFADMYLALWALVVVGTAAIFFMPPRMVLAQPLLILGVGAGWLLIFAGYLFMVANACLCITSGLKRQHAKLKAALGQD
jgi:hypothetical protein